MKVSCIIAAYNEEPRIGNVLRAAENHPLIGEIIVVDDGSKDGTRERVKQFPGIQLIALSKNVGKTKAVIAGIQAAKGEFIFLLDADLIDLTPQNITELFSPVLSGSAEVGISLRKNSPWPWRKLGIDFISGERIFPKTLVIGQMKKMAELPRFGLEVFLNRLIIKNKCSLKIIFWKNVVSPLKFRKQGSLKGLWSDALMILDIFRVISPFEFVYQIIMMIRRRIRD